MAKLARYSPKIAIPGQFFPQPISPQKQSPVVVKLLTGEKVQLLAAEKPPAHKQARAKTGNSSCKSIRTIPGRYSQIDYPTSIDSSPHTPIFGPLDSDYEGCNNLGPVSEVETPLPRAELAPQLANSIDALDITESIELSYEVHEVAESIEVSHETLEDAESIDLSEHESEIAESLRQIQTPPLPPPQLLSKLSPIQTPSAEVVEVMENPIFSAQPESLLYAPSAAVAAVAVAATTTASAEIAKSSAEVAKSSAESNSSQWLSSPHAMISFSPENAVEAQTQLQLNYTISEVLQSEYAYVKSLSLLSNFFLEPLLVKATGLRLTCSPLLKMDFVIRTLQQKHERFLARISIDKSLDRLSREMSQVVAEPCYGNYAASAEVLLLLVRSQVPPLESSYVSNLQHFLERNQPGERRMDLSLSSLLQKPMGRIAKYRLFLGSLAKLCPEQRSVAEALTSVNSILMKINEDIKSNKDRQGLLETTIEWLDLSDNNTPIYQYYGLIDNVLTCTAVWLTHNRRLSVEPVFREIHMFFHRNHVICADSKTHKPLFVLSIANCQFIADASSSVGGIYCSNTQAMKFIFERANCQYELMFINHQIEDHTAMLHACAGISGAPLRYICASDSDCFIGPAIAPFDLNLAVPQVVQAHSSTCYFRQSHDVYQRPQSSRFQSVKVMFRRSLGWSKPE